MNPATIEIGFNKAPIPAVSLSRGSRLVWAFFWTAGSPGALTWEHLARQPWSPPRRGINEDLGAPLFAQAIYGNPPMQVKICEGYEIRLSELFRGL